MPSLDDLLMQSMLFTATHGRAHADPVHEKFRSSRPVPQTAADLGEDLDEETVRNNAIWQMSWDPAAPGTFTDITLLSRGMGMDYRMPVTAYDRLEFREVRAIRTNGASVDLFLDAAHMIGAWEGRVGQIRPLSDVFHNPRSIWKVPTRIDSSMLVAFGYRLDGPQARALSMVECEVLGQDLMPPPGTPRPRVTFTAREGASAVVRVDYPRYIVVVELVLCRENPDFVPGPDMIGFARIHPHALVWSTEGLERVETTIVMARPRKAMNHGDPAMHTRHKALLVTDTNVSHTEETFAGIDVPVPVADALYDYYEDSPVSAFAERVPTDDDHPLQRLGEVTLADARFTSKRRIRGAVKRRTAIVSKADEHRDVVKWPRQGQFDNVHLAPRMRLVLDSLGDGRGSIVVDDSLPMVFVCLHDCCHMHVRWSALFDDPAIAGWENGQPNAGPGRPGVPENQTVFASFPTQHTLRYRAVAETVGAGDLTVVCHHGLAYAVHEWPDSAAIIFGLQNGLDTLAAAYAEPYMGASESDPWALFYFRVRTTGHLTSQVPLEWAVYPRLEFDLARCME